MQEDVGRRHGRLVGFFLSILCLAKSSIKVSTYYPYFQFTSLKKNQAKWEILGSRPWNYTTVTTLLFNECLIGSHSSRRSQLLLLLEFEEIRRHLHIRILTEKFEVEAADGNFQLFRGRNSDPDSINICVKISQTYIQLCISFQGRRNWFLSGQTYS